MLPTIMITINIRTIMAITSILFLLLLSLWDAGLGLYSQQPMQLVKLT